MSSRRRRYRLLPTLPAVVRIAGVLLAIVIGWTTTLGATLGVFFLAWHIGFWADAYFTGFVLETTPRATLIPLPWQDAERYLMLAGWVAGAMTFLGIGVYLLRGLKPALNRLTGQAPIARVKKDHALWPIAQDVRRDAGLITRPSFWVVASEAPIAFAYSAPLGRHAVVLSTGLVKGMPDPALRFVIAHELAHIHYRDTESAAIWLASAQAMQIFVRLRLKGLRAIGTLFGSIPLLRDFAVLPFTLVTWVLHQLTRLGFGIARLIFLLTDRWVSRHMEYRADAFAADTTSPRCGVAALSALEGDAEPLFGGLFATHPPIKQRIARLQAMSSAR